MKPLIYFLFTKLFLLRIENKEKDNFYHINRTLTATYLVIYKDNFQYLRILNVYGLIGKQG